VIGARKSRTEVEIAQFRCHFHDIDGVGIGLLPDNASCTISNCNVSGARTAVYVHGLNEVVASNSVFWGGIDRAFYLNGVKSTFVRDCEIYNGGSQYSIWCEQNIGFGGVRHDFRGNYWGTDDPNQIEEWILDGHDDPNIRAEVLFTPFATGSTDLVVTMTPMDSQVVIPEAGGTSQYDAYLENNTAVDIVADLALEAVMPDGSIYPVMAIPGQNIPAASAYTRVNLIQTVPPGAPAGTYRYRLTASLGDSVLVDSDEFPFDKEGAVAAAVSDGGWALKGWNRDGEASGVPVASGLILHPASPNPFNPTTTLAFELPAAESVILRVYDIQGRLVRTLLSGEGLPEGRHEAVWDGRTDTGAPAPSGTYFYRVEAGVNAETGRMVLVK